MAEQELTHLDEKGAARMVDVGAKAVTAREAVAEGELGASAETVAALFAGALPKGDAIAAARIAGIQAAKKTAELIPLCHPLMTSGIDLEIEKRGKTTVYVRATVRVMAQTGVEMEALTAVSIALLTLYDMLKALQKDMVIGNIRLVKKSGGKSGAQGKGQKA